MKQILRCTKKYLPFIILTPLVLVVEVILELRIPQIMAAIVDQAIPAHDIDLVRSLGISMILTASGSLLTGFLGTIFGSTGAMGFGSELRKEVFGRIQDFSFENIDSFQQSSLLTRMTTDVDNVQMGLRMMMTMAIRAPFMMVAAAIAAYGINQHLFVVFAVAIPVLIIAVAILGSIVMPKFRYMLTKYDGLNDDTKEYLTNVRVVKSFVQEEHEQQKFFGINKELMDSSIDVETLMVLMGPLMQLVIYGTVLAVYYLGGLDIAAGRMQIGILTAFISYIAQIMMGLLMAVFLFMNAIRLKSSVDRLSEVLVTDSTIKDGSYDGAPADGSIDFEAVSFRYSGAGRDSVKKVSLHINSGETIGVIGSTGCGKSSLVQLIPRLYDVTSGTLKVGGRDVRDYHVDTLRDDVAMVLQQNMLFSGTIRDNMRWGDPKATDQQIEDACRKAQAHDFIMSFPDGYDTDLGQGGVNVSGGQKQRLCIARALLKKPKIIIMDDSTSAVDTHTDALIRQALATELKDTTALIIAQRISSVMDADRVIVMDNGRVADFDTPERLLETNDIYKDIYDTQMKGVELNA